MKIYGKGGKLLQGRTKIRRAAGLCLKCGFRVESREGSEECHCGLMSVDAQTGLSVEFENRDRCVDLSEIEVNPEVDGPYRIFGFSDYHAADSGPSPEHDCHRDRIFGFKPDFILSSGDQSYLGEDSKRFLQLVGEAGKESTGVPPVGFVLGNHESHNGNGYDLRMLGALDLTWDICFVGDVLIFGIDVFSPDDHPPRRPQTRFKWGNSLLDLFSKRVKFHSTNACKKVLLSHMPPMEYVPLNRSPSAFFREIQSGQEIVSRIVNETNPDIVLFGHVHTGDDLEIPGPQHCYPHQFRHGRVLLVNLSAEGGVGLEV